MTEANEVLQQREILTPTKLDALIVLGKNIGEGWSPEKIRRTRNLLSGHSKLNVLAAGDLYNQGLTQRIIFSTGQTAGADYPSEALAMKAFLKEKFPQIPDSAIILEENSIDTAGNAEEVAKIIEKHGFSNVGLLTVGFHLPNARTLFERFGVKIDDTDSFKAEEIVKDRAKKPELFVESYSNSPLVKREKRKERVRTILLYTIDRRGRLLREVTKRQRK